jgi:transcriptional regulator with XRE-family HTH domain
MYDIKKAIKAHGWTLAKVSKALGIAPPSLTQQITENTIALRRVQEIADIIGCPLSELIGGKDNDFTAYIKCNGIHYTADSLAELNKIVEELNIIAK